MSKIDEILKNEKVEWKKLGEICIDKFWVMPTTPKFIQNGIPYITGKNIKDGKIDFDNVKYISQDDYNNISKNRDILKNDILVSMIGTIGEIGLVCNSIKFYGQNLYLLRLNKKIILNKFFYHYFSQNKIKQGLISKKNSSSQGYIRAGQLEYLEIPIPSLETQEKIVDILDKFTNYVNELQAELQARNKQYEYYRDMLLSEEYLNKRSSELFIKNINSITKCKLKDIATITRGKRLVRSDLEEIGKFPVFQNSLKPLGYYYDRNFSGDKACVISAGAAGEIFYREEDFWAADDVLVINSDTILNKFIYYFLLSNQRLIKTKVRKASVPRLSRDEVENLEILVPSMELQKIIVKVLDKFQSLVIDTKGLLPKEIEKRQKQYEYYREKLLDFPKK